jgi:fatty acid desaturase
MTGYKYRNGILQFYYRQVKLWLTECFRGMIFQWGLLKMKKLLTLLLVLTAIFLNSCAVVGGIFKAGVWVGILIVVFIIGIIIWLVTRSGKS